MVTSMESIKSVLIVCWCGYEYTYAGMLRRLPRCGEADESIEHSIFDCSFSNIFGEPQFKSGL